MAGLKKKKKEKSGSPNLVLVIFLVFFVLSTIVLGVFFYLSIEERDLAKKQKEDGVKVLAAEKATGSYYRLLYRELRVGLGDELLENEKKELPLDRETFRKGGFDKGSLTDKEGALKIIKTLGDTLGETPDGYNKNYPQLLREAEKERDELRGKATAAIAQHELTKQQITQITKNSDTIYNAANASIKGNNDTQLKLINAKSAAFIALTEDLRKNKLELEEKGKEMQALVEGHLDSLRLKDKEIALLRQANRDRDGDPGKPGAAANVASSGPSSPLMLDINMGKTLWDVPVGRITRVDLDLRQVVIELFHLGAKPDLTFTIFAAGANGRAEKQMKGSIEIIKVLDAKSAMARITTLFDGDGVEIPLGLQTRGRILRETDTPLREGDLIFNMFWGTHVAIGGLVSLDDSVSSNPADQQRSVLNMVNLLERQGMIVDAYVDLTDGLIRGKITNKTRYFIIGDAIQVKSLLPSLDGDWKGQNIDLNFSGPAFRGEIRVAGADEKINVNRLNGIVQENGGKRFLPWGNNDVLEIVLEDDGKMVLENKALMVRHELMRIGGFKEVPAKKEVKEMKKEDDPGEKEMKKDPDPGMKAEPKQEQRGRSLVIAEGIKLLKDDATAKGLVQISSENFLNVIGYRRARSATTTERSNFRPALPYFAEPDLRQPVRPAEPMPKAPAPDDDKKGEK